MKDQHDDDTFGLLAPIDDEAGPAETLADWQATRIAQQVVARALLANDVSAREQDPQQGPALRLDAAQTQAIATRVTQRFQRRTWLWQAAAACVLAMAVGSAAWAAVRVWLEPTIVTSNAQPHASRLPPARSAQSRHTTAQPTTTTPPSVDALPIETPVSLSAEQLLDRANAARARREWAAAERLYSRVVQVTQAKSGARDATLTDTAYAALVAAAALQLEHLRQPRAALSSYRSALSARPYGSLNEEARYGLANAHRALNDETAERGALTQFLTHHPESLFAPHARARLAELSGGSR